MTSGKVMVFAPVRIITKVVDGLPHMKHTFYPETSVGHLDPYGWNGAWDWMLAEARGRGYDVPDDLPDLRDFDGKHHYVMHVGSSAEQCALIMHIYNIE